MFKLSKNSEDLLNTVDKDLQDLTRAVIKVSPFDFAITCGYRSQLLQEKYYKEGKTKTMSSKHTEGLAIDIVPFINGKQNYDAVEELLEILGAFKVVANQMNIKIRCGDNWNNGKLIKENSFIDMYHIELLR